MDEICSDRVDTFYHNSLILISGVTGFMGQVLLEKILRSLKPRKIYVLIRQKRNVTIHQRLKQLLAGAIFDKARDEKLFNRIIPLEVNFDRDDLSLDEDLRLTLAKEVDIVFNLVAAVKLREPLMTALEINVEYTRRLLRLVTMFQHLRAVIHVSTLYSNCDQPFIEEKICDDIPFGGYENLRVILANLTPMQIELLTPHVLGNFPNTYTFSKKCTEVMIRDHFGNLPIGIFRPPIVSSCDREPIPGWVNNFNGLCAVVSSVNQGIFQVWPIDSTKKPFLAPVDYCINGILVCAMDVSQSHSQFAEIVPVYNFADSENIHDWGRIYSGWLRGMSPIKRFINGRILTWFATNQSLYIFLQQLMRLQGHVADSICAIFGQKKQFSPLVEKLINTADVAKCATNVEWQMDNRNMLRVVKSLSPEEALDFPCDLRDVDWPTHWINFTRGVLEYIRERQVIQANKKNKATNVVTDKMQIAT